MTDTAISLMMIVYKSNYHRMSYSSQDAKNEFHSFEEETIKTKNIEQARVIANQWALEDNMEQAEWWEAEACKWEAELDAKRDDYREAREEREIEEAERHTAPSEGFKI